MNNYETIMVLSSKVDDEKRKEVIKRIEDYIKENGKITKIDDIGIRKLAYEVKKHKEGYYYVIYFDAKSECIGELERLYRITDEVIKFMTVKHN